MPRSRFVLGSLFAATFVVAGCQDQVVMPVTAPSTSRMAVSNSASLQQSTLKARTTRIALPSSVVSPQLVFGEYGRPAVTPTACSSSSPVTDYLYAELDRTLAIEPGIFFTMYDLAAADVPTYEALYFQSASTPQYYGYNGDFTKAIVKTEKDIKRFWDIPSSDIQVVAMHGTMLLDTARVARTYRLFGYSPAEAAAYAAEMHDALAQSTTMNGGNFAFWTFNAFSFSTPSHSPSDRVVMGDGILEAYAAIGFGDIAPQAIFAHEYAHQVQFENNYFDDLPASASPAQQTRYTELMADAMAAYFLTHSRGASLNQKRVEQFLEVFYDIGDCAFTDPGHHGTPSQRLAAARFGFTIADQAQKQGHILTAAEFHALFAAAYSTLVAPDAY